MLNRATPEAPPNLALTPTEIAVLDRLVHDRPKARRRTLSHYLTKIARLGGYLARASDPPPGNSVMWRGLSRLTDIALGATVGCDNGADDFIRKPFSHRLLVERIKVLLRRATPKDGAPAKEANSNVLERGQLRMDPAAFLHLEKRAGDAHRH